MYHLGDEKKMNLREAAKYVLEHTTPEGRGRMISRFLEGGNLYYGTYVNYITGGTCLVGSLCDIYQDPHGSFRMRTPSISVAGLLPIGDVDHGLIYQSWDSYCKEWGIEAAREVVNQVIHEWIQENSMVYDKGELITA